MNNNLAYLSGPVSGVDEQTRIEAFSEAEKKVREMGYEKVYNPLNDTFNVKMLRRHKAGEFSEVQIWQMCMKVCISKLIMSDVVFMLPGWEGSRGASIEYELSRSLGIPVMFI